MGDKEKLQKILSQIVGEKVAKMFVDALDTQDVCWLIVVNEIKFGLNLLEHVSPSTRWKRFYEIKGDPALGLDPRRCLDIWQLWINTLARNAEPTVCTELRQLALELEQLQEEYAK